MTQRVRAQTAAVRCKFCGCTERNACRISGVSCSWLIPGVCTNPRCVEKAYLEARELAVPIMESLLLREELLIA